MANMIEQSLLCKVLDAPDLEILHSNGVVEEMFLTCRWRRAGRGIRRDLLWIA